MKNREFKIKAEVWRWPGEGGWHFITLDKALSQQIRKSYPKGFVKIKAKIGQTSWDTSLFPHKRSESYLLSVKALVRKKEDIFEGDEAKIGFRIIGTN
jgi:hypothetical protein